MQRFFALFVFLAIVDLSTLSTQTPSISSIPPGPVNDITTSSTVVSSSQQKTIITSSVGESSFTKTSVTKSVVSPASTQTDVEQNFPKPSDIATSSSQQKPIITSSVGESSVIETTTTQPTVPPSSTLSLIVQKSSVGTSGPSINITPPPSVVPTTMQNSEDPRVTKTSQPTVLSFSTQSSIVRSSSAGESIHSINLTPKSSVVATSTVEHNSSVGDPHVSQTETSQPTVLSSSTQSSIGRSSSAGESSHSINVTPKSSVVATSTVEQNSSVGDPHVPQTETSQPTVLSSSTQSSIVRSSSAGESSHSINVTPKSSVVATSTVEQNSSVGDPHVSQTETPQPTVLSSSTQSSIVRSSSAEESSHSINVTPKSSVVATSTMEHNSSVGGVTQTESLNSTPSLIVQYSSDGTSVPSIKVTSQSTVIPTSTMMQNSSVGDSHVTRTRTTQSTALPSSTQPSIVPSSSGGESSPTPSQTPSLGITETSSDRPTSVPSPSPTTTAVIATSSVAPSILYYEYTVTFTITSIKETKENNDYETLSLLITECEASFVEESSIYFAAFQRYILKIICSVYKTQECVVVVKKLECGSLKPDLQVTTTTNSTDPVADMVEDGQVGDLGTNKTSFVGAFEGSAVTKPTVATKRPDYAPKTYVVATLGYTWREFCGVVEEHFKERVAERSYDLNTKQIKPNQIVIFNHDEKCKDPTDDDDEIDVKFVVVAKEQDAVTKKVGEDLMDLVDAGQTRKLGNLFEDKLLKVRVVGITTARKSGLSDTAKIWLAVGVIIGTILIFSLLYWCCCRKREKEADAERNANHYAMDRMDGDKKPTNDYDNRGFDEIDVNEPPARISTFKGENGNFPQTKNNGEQKTAPLSREEESDNELDMVVKDVAIEDENENEAEPTPAGTLPIIPPDPVHMAILETPQFLKEVRNQEKIEKEYEDLDKSVTDPKIYPHTTIGRNRTPTIVANSESRVKLPEENDYINANYIKDHHGNANFIATQHPLSNTMRDFWTMVWQENVGVIVMVNEKENDMENYHNYWLDHKNSLTIYGHMQVRTEQLESKAGYKVTKFVLQNSQEGDEIRTVIHFHFTDWQNEKINDAKTFVKFVRDVEKTRLENTKSPVVVHCSQAQSFTGVFIASNIALRVFNESDKKSTIKVFDCVEKMRKDRNLIVCSKELYTFIYKVVSLLVCKDEHTDSKL